MPFLIHFFGADGVGKTTQAKLLVCWLKQRGINTRLVRIRSGRTLASLIYRLFAGIDSSLVERGEDGRVIRINIIERTPHREIWFLIEFLSMIPWILIGVYIPMAFGKSVIAERYVIDAIASIAYLVNELSWPRKFPARILLRFVPRSTIFIHLDASYMAIMKRKGSHIDPREYLEYQMKTYSSFAKTLGAISIDTSDLPLLDVQKRIRQYLDLILGINDSKN